VADTRKLTTPLPSPFGFSAVAPAIFRVSTRFEGLEDTIGSSKFELLQESKKKQFKLIIMKVILKRYFFIFFNLFVNNSILALLLISLGISSFLLKIKS